MVGGYLVDFHHGGQFVDGKYMGTVTTWECESDLLLYAEVVDFVKKLGYIDIAEMWYDFCGNLKPLSNDFGAIELENWGRTKGKVHVYIVHAITQPDFVDEAQLKHMTQCDNVAQLEPMIEPMAQAEHVAQTEPMAQLESEDESEDSALDVIFGDSDDEFYDEVCLNDEVNLKDIGGVDKVVGGVDKEVGDDEVRVVESKKKKNKGGRPKKVVDESTSKKRKGKVVVPNEVNLFDEEPSDEELLNARKKGKLVDVNEDYHSEDLETDVESDNEMETEPRPSTQTGPSFVMPKNMTNYKWVLCSKFSSKQEFKDAIKTYSIHNNKGIKLSKNDKTRCKAVCRPQCPWVAYCTKMSHEDTWMLRTLNDVHKCPPDFQVQLMNSKWLGDNLVSTIRENLNIKLIDICTKAQQKWHTRVTRMKAYRAKRAAIDKVDGSFREQYRRLHDYCREIKRSNPLSTVKLTVQSTEIVEGGNSAGYVDRPLLPSFQRLYMCLDGFNDLGGQRFCKTFTFISDQQKGLLPAIEELLPGVEQRSSKYKKKKLEKEQQLARFWMCRLAGEKLYDVVSLRVTDDIIEKYIVDLNKLECSCRRWMLTGIPCCHAIACYIDRHEDPESAIPSMFRKEAYEDVYSHIIYPTNCENLWVKTPYVDILPPPLRRAPGRPKRSRNKDADEKRPETGNAGRKGMVGRCTKCKQPGHNKTTCKAPNTNPTPTNTTPAPSNTNAPNTTPPPSNTNATNTISPPSNINPLPSKKTKDGPSQPLPTSQPLLSNKSKVGPSQPLPSKAPTTSKLFSNTVSLISDASRKKMTPRRAQN
ncbi:hypothetical protein QL285_043581 [Trifolium repens]|nr:hypothetical protein QL285_043581 [Trifolium repens]